MKFTCPKCGKTIELSPEALEASNHFTVCPQCLTRLQIVGDYAYVPLADGTLQLNPEPPSQSSEPAPEAPQSTATMPSAVKRPPTFAPPAKSAPTEAAPPVPAAVDPLMGRAIALLSQCNAITTLMLSQQLGITMERAQALMQQLEQAGVVGPYNGGGPRAILIPHRTELPSPYSSTADGGKQQASGSDGQPTEPADNKTYTFNCSSCLTMFIVAAFIVFMLKTCA